MNKLYKMDILQMETAILAVKEFCAPVSDLTGASLDDSIFQGWKKELKDMRESPDSDPPKLIYVKPENEKEARRLVSEDSSKCVKWLKMENDSFIKTSGV